ncbi:MAG: ankyrin repeat domain-containing protein, partial [Proteobacteria bacterium]|nr:ankyrin repeat domain-containing protein [Pseudomonadota bacterium]
MGKNQKKPKKKLAGQRIPQKVERLDPSVLIIQSRFPDLLSKNRELHRAVLSGSISYVIDLLKSGADPRAVAGDHFTIESKHSVLYVASYLGFEPIVRELLRNGADPRVKTMDGSTPIIAACQQGHTRVVEILYDAAPDMLDTPDLDGELPLIVAVSNRHHETAAFLVAKRANVNATNARGANSLFFPVQFRAFNTVELLLQNGVKINHARISDGNTVLHNAVALGYLEIVALLLKNGADSTIINLQGFTAKNFMKEEQTEEMSELLEHPEIADQILSRPRF